ncbi:MAG: DUF5694 domain-containing protein [Chitinophagaceae bacterium]
MKKNFVFIAVLLFAKTVFAQSNVYLIPTLGELHKTNVHYNYDSLKANIERLNADIIAVELRPEDINADSNYLAKNYPDEMWMMHYWFPQITIKGFDWIDNDIEGKPIPDNYWQQQSNIKQWQNALSADATATKTTARCKVYADARLKILQASTLQQLLNSYDGLLTKNYYDCLGISLQNTEHNRITKYYQQRNVMMANQIVKIVNENPGKKIVVIIGDDHYPFVKDLLQKENIFAVKIY